MTIYDLITLCINLALLWVVWRYGWRRLALDEFRQWVFGIRDQLFIDAAKKSDGLSLDSEGYRLCREHINALLRCSHEINVSTLLIASLPPVAKRTKHIVLPLDAEISKMPKGETRTRIENVRSSVAIQLAKFLTKVSPSFIVMIVTALIACLGFLFARHQLNQWASRLRGLVVERLEPSMRLMEAR